MIIQKVEKSRLETIDKDNLTFGSGFTDHMIVCDTAVCLVKKDESLDLCLMGKWSFLLL